MVSYLPAPVKQNLVALLPTICSKAEIMTARSERLRQARVDAGFERQREAVERFGWNRNTYKSNENGMAPFSFEQAKVYAKAFDVEPQWLYDGTGPMKAGRGVPIAGYVGAGAEAHLFGAGQGPLDFVQGPDDATSSTVAVEIRGESLGPIFNEWLVFYDDVRSPVTPDLHGRLCVVGLAGERVLIKQLRPSRKPGLYDLLSQTEGVMADQEVLWAARVKSMRPR